MRSLPRGTVTFLFTDIEGSTQLLQEHAERYAELLSEHRSVLREAFARHGGVEVDTQGDAFFVAFSRASDAIAAALDGQAAHDDGPIRVRMGLHTGEPIREGDKFFGKTVILAARIAAQAKAGEILVSAILQQLLEASHAFSFGAPRDLALKGLAGMHRVFAVDWDGG